MEGLLLLVQPHCRPFSTTAVMAVPGWNIYAVFVRKKITAGEVPTPENSKPVQRQQDVK